MSFRKAERYLKQSITSRTGDSEISNLRAAVAEILKDVKEQQQFIAEASKSLWPDLMKEEKVMDQVVCDNGNHASTPHERVDGCSRVTVIKRAPMSVLQYWVQRLNFMQQTVLITAMRGPDGVDKNHVSKPLLKWLRRCVLYSAFESRKTGAPFAFVDPYTPGGGKFTGPHARWTNPFGATYPPADAPTIERTLASYLDSCDGVPNHFQLHFMHAAEIVGYKHPEPQVRAWWRAAYEKLVRAMHVWPETEEQMDKRLGDDENDWRAREEGGWPELSDPTTILDGESTK